MLRRLLTLLAVVTSFVSLVEPVQAARLDNGIEATTTAERAASCMSAMLEVSFRIERSPGVSSTQHMRCPAAPTQYAPAVRLQADRARE